MCPVLNLLSSTYIFGWHNLLKLVESELLLALAHVLPEDLLQPGDVVLSQYTTFTATRFNAIVSRQNRLSIAAVR